MMKNRVKKLRLLVLVLVLTAFGWHTPTFSAEKQFHIRADGLACPYCAYGIEKKLMKIRGVKQVDIDMKKGLVLVTGDEKLVLNDPQLTTLFNDAGFTFRKVVKVSIKE